MCQQYYFTVNVKKKLLVILMYISIFFNTVLDDSTESESTGYFVHKGLTPEQFKVCLGPLIDSRPLTYDSKVLGCCGT